MVTAASGLNPQQRSRAAIRMYKNDTLTEHTNGHEYPPWCFPELHAGSTYSRPSGKTRSRVRGLSPVVPPLVLSQQCQLPSSWGTWLVQELRLLAFQVPHCFMPPATSCSTLHHTSAAADGLC